MLPQRPGHGFQAECATDETCEAKFTENPFPYALHAFAERPVALHKRVHRGVEGFAFQIVGGRQIFFTVRDEERDALAVGMRTGEGEPRRGQVLRNGLEWRHASGQELQLAPRHAGRHDLFHILHGGDVRPVGLNGPGRPGARQRDELQRVDDVRPLMAEPDEVANQVVIDPPGHHAHDYDTALAVLADVVQRLQLLLVHLPVAAQLLVHFRGAPIEGENQVDARRQQPPAIRLVGQSDAVGDNTRRKSQPVRARDQLDKVPAHGRLAAEKLDRGPRCERGEVPENLLEVLQWRLELEAHTGDIGDTDGAVLVAAIGDVHKNRRGRVRVRAVETVQLASAVALEPVNLSFGMPSGRVRRDNRLRPAAVGTLLDQEHLSGPLLVAGGSQLAAFVAITEM